MNEEELYRMSDEDLEAAFFAAKGTDESFDENLDSPNEFESEITEFDNTPEDDTSTEESSNEEIAAEENINEEMVNEPAPQEQNKVSEKIKYKANGKDYEFTQEEILQQFPKVFGQAVDYTKKMQTIKPWRKTIDAIEQAKLSHQDVSLMIDALQGNKDAISSLLKRTGVDSLELDTENSKYVPNNYGRDEEVIEIEGIIDQISKDPEYEITKNVLAREWDDKSWKEMTSNPELIKGLHVDVKSGMYTKLAPIAEKLKLFDGGRRSDLEYYGAAAAEHNRDLVRQARISVDSLQPKENQQLVVARQNEEKRQQTNNAASQRKAAAPTKSGTSKPTGVVDYLDASEENFDEWYKNLQNKM